MIEFLKRAVRWPWFGRRFDVRGSIEPETRSWPEDPFYFKPEPSACAKNIRLAEIARERADLIANKDEIKRSKKGYYTRLRALTHEEMKLEGSLVATRKSV